MATVIATDSLTKVFPPSVIALDAVSVNFAAGEVHAVVGENGAGKSTLMKVIYGLHEPDSGSFAIGGRRVSEQTPARAIAAGVGMVHQEIVLVDEFSVWENVVLGAEPVRSLGRLDRAAARTAVAHRIEEFGLALDPDSHVGSLSVAAQQKVEILKLLYRDVSVLILDEPTAVLAPQEVEGLFDELRRLRAGGRTIIFVSHHLDEVIDLSDRITVMRRGRTVATVDASATSRAALATMMVGREVIFPKVRAGQPAGETGLECTGVSTVGASAERPLTDITLTVGRGEIVAVAGVEGNGQRELIQALVGLTAVTAGRITAAGADITASTILERRRSLAYVSEDRGRMGASRRDSILDNARMTHHRLAPSFSRWGGIALDTPRAERFVEEIRARFSVTMGASSDPFSSLSGGNQQKVILARELALGAPVLVLDQPTRGLDVGSIEYVHRTIIEERDAGRAILLVSSDLDEILRLADRIIVLFRGRIVATIPAAVATPEILGRWMLEGRSGE